MTWKQIIAQKRKKYQDSAAKLKRMKRIWKSKPKIEQTQLLHKTEYGFCFILLILPLVQEAILLKQIKREQERQAELEEKLQKTEEVIENREKYVDKLKNEIEKMQELNEKKGDISTRMSKPIVKKTKVTTEDLQKLENKHKDLLAELKTVRELNKKGEDKITKFIAESKLKEIIKRKEIVTHINLHFV